MISITTTAVSAHYSPISELVVCAEPVDSSPQEEAAHPDTGTLAVDHAPPLYGQFPQDLAPGQPRPYQGSVATAAQGSLHQLQGSQAELER